METLVARAPAKAIAGGVAALRHAIEAVLTIRRTGQRCMARTLSMVIES
jgi:hypothetical protein